MVDAVDINGSTALLKAAGGGHKGVVMALLEAKAEVNLQNFDGKIIIIIVLVTKIIITKKYYVKKIDLQNADGMCAYYTRGDQIKSTQIKYYNCKIKIKYYNN